MKASFLKSLLNLLVPEAEETVKKSGLTPKTLPEGNEYHAMMIQSQTIILFQKEGKIIRAEPGDVGEVEQD